MVVTEPLVKIQSFKGLPQSLGRRMGKFCPVILEEESLTCDWGVETIHEKLKPEYSN